MSDERPPTGVPSTEAIDGDYGTALLDLTDEEMFVLDPAPPEERLVVMPYFDQLEEAQRNMAFTTAYRGLAARGMVIPPTQEDVDAADTTAGGSGTIEISVDEMLATLIQMRKIAPTIVCAQRTVSVRQDYCYWYVLSEESTLEEFVEPLGLHRFRSIDTRLVQLALYGYLNPLRVDGQDGQELMVDAAGAAAGETPAAMLEELGSSNTLGEFLVRHGGEPPEHPLMVSVGSAEGRLLLAEMRFGSGDPVRVKEVAAATLYARIEELVAGELAQLPESQENGPAS